MNEDSVIKTSLAPWINVPANGNAIEFYKNAFNATEVYRLEDPGGGIVVRLSVDGAEFWISEDSSPNIIDKNVGSGNVRMILIVPDPDKLFHKAIQAGAQEIFPVGVDHGWKLGRIEDPFGLHWEIGHPVPEEK